MNKRMWIAISLLALIASACTSRANTTRQNSPQPSADQVFETVAISEFKFAPAELTVPVGTTVVWTNQDSFRHTVTSGDFSGATNVADGAFGLDLPKKGATAEHTFTKAGTFTYFCRQHNVMNASVVVEETRGDT